MRFRLKSLLAFTISSHAAFQSPDLFFHALNREKRYVTYPSGTAIGVSLKYVGKYE